MSKHSAKKQQKNDAMTAVTDTPSQLLEKFSLSEKEECYCREQLASEGPEHKQAYAALLLQRMASLVSAVERSSGCYFTPQNGYTMSYGKHKAVALPIELPCSALKKEDVEDAIKILSKSPEHEGILFNLLLQAIEWSIKNTGRKEAEN